MVGGALVVGTKGGSRIALKVFRKIARFSIFKVAPPVLEVIYLGPLGPFLCGLGIGAIQTAVQVPGFVTRTIALKNPIKIAFAVLTGPITFWSRVRFRRKLLICYGLAHHFNGASRREERVQRAAGVQALRRLDGKGVTKLMSAIQDPFLFDLMMPDCIRNDQEWVQIAESWTDDFTRERETTPWLNRALSVLWPFINDIAAQAVEELVEPLIMEQLKTQSVVTSVVFASFSLGTVAPQIDSIFVQDLNRERPDELVVDFNASWAGNPDIVLAVTGKFVSGFGPSTFNVALTNLEFKGKFRATIKPLLDVLPVIGGAAVMMVQEPYIDYEVRLKSASGGDGTSLDNIPFLKSFIIGLVQNTITDVLLFPNCVPVVIAGDPVGAEKGSLEESLKMAPVGRLKIEVLSASGLMAADFGGKSDPYVKLGLGLSTKSITEKSLQKSTCIKSTLNPVWNQSFTFDVYDRNLQKLVLFVYDEDLVGNDDLIGELTLMINDLVAGQPLEQTYTLRGPAGQAKKDKFGKSAFGEILLALTWLPSQDTQERARNARRKSDVLQQKVETLQSVGDANPATVKNGFMNKLHSALVFHMKTQSEYLTHFKDNIAEALHIPTTKGSLSKYLVNDKGTLAAFSNEEVRRMGKYMPISYGVHGGLPTWAFNPDFNTMQNMDQLLLQIWPHMEVTVNHLMERFSNEKLNEIFVPESLRKLVVLKMIFKFGELPPLLECIRVYPGKNKDMIMEMNVKVAGDQVMGGTATFTHSPFVSMEMVMSQMQFVGNFRLRLRPLVPLVPIVSGVSMSIMGAPIWDASCSVKLSPLVPALDLCSVPGFRLFRHMVMKYAIKPLLMHPCAVHMPILDMSHPAVKYHLTTKEKVQRVLLVNIIEATNLQAADAMGGLSDPYTVMIHSGAGSFGSRYYRTPTINDNLNPCWKHSLDFETDTDDVTLVFGIFDSDVSAKEEAKQALMQRKKKNAKNVSSAENHKVLAKMLELLHEEVAISREVASRFKVNFDSVPFSAFMDEYVISEAPPDQPPSTFKKFKLGLLDIIDEETKAGLNRLRVEETAGAEGGQGESGAEASTDTTKERTTKITLADAGGAVIEDGNPGNFLANVVVAAQVDALAADTQKPKVPNQSSDLEYLLQSEVAQNGNDLLGAVMIHPDQLPEDLSVKEMWCDLVLNPDLPPPKAPPKLRLSFQWMLLAQKDAAGSAQDSQEKRLGTMTVWVLRAGDLYAGRSTKGKKLKPVVVLTLGDESKETTPGAGRDPQWGGDEDKLVFHNVDPSFVLDVAVHNSNTSYMAMLTMQPTDLGTLQIPVQEFARAGQTTGTYQLESKSGKGSVTLKVLWRQVMGDEALDGLQSARRTSDNPTRASTNPHEKAVASSGSAADTVGLALDVRRVRTSA